MTVTESDLKVVGVNNPSYSFSGFSYNATTFTATWTLASPIADDNVLLELDGSDSNGVNAGGVLLDGAWTNGLSTYPSGNGAAGSNFDFQFDVLPGDVNASGGVNLTDYLLVRSQIGDTTTSSGYNFRYDVTGQGSITATTASIVRALVGATSPSGNPSATTVTVADTTGTSRRHDREAPPGAGSHLMGPVPVARGGGGGDDGPGGGVTPDGCCPGGGTGESLEAALQSAEADGNQSDTITLGADDYLVNNFTIQNISGVAGKVIYIQGVGAGQTLIDGGGAGRIFIVEGGIHVVFQNLTIEKGFATDDGQGGTSTAEGGAS